MTHYLKVNGSDVTEVVIGDTVRAVIDYGVDIAADRVMKISRCSLISGNLGSEIQFITNGTVISPLTSHVQLVETNSNRLSEFTWRVFTSGHGSQATISCQMKIEKISSETTTVTTTTMTTTTSEYVTTTAPSTPALLMLGSYSSSPAPRLIGPDGELSTTFSLNGQEVWASCPVTHQNQQYLFGGYTNKKQVLQLDNCELNPIGNIPFNFYSGGGVSLGGLIILCFNMLSSAPEYKLCRSAVSAIGGTWTELELSTYEHDTSSISPSTGYTVA